MAKPNPYSRLSKEEQVSIVERQAAAKLQELHGLDVDRAQLEAVPQRSRDDAWKATHSQVTSGQEETERLAYAIDSRDKAISGRPLSIAARKPSYKPVAML